MEAEKLYEFTIQIFTPHDAAFICKCAESIPADIDIRSQNRHYTVSACSLMGILSLNFTEPLIVSTYDQSAHDRMKNDLNKFIVE